MYKPYDGVTMDSRRAHLLAGSKLKPHQMRSFLSDVLEAHVCGNLVSGEGVIGQDSILTLLEMVHYLLVHKVYYVPTDFARKFLSSRIQVRLDQVRIPNSLFEVSFDEDFRVGGIKVPSCLVLAKPDKTVVSGMKTFLTEVRDRLVTKMNDERARAVVNNYLGADFSPTIYNSFGVRFRSPIKGDDSMCHMSINSRKEEGRTVDQVVESIGTMRGVAMPVGPVEKEMQKATSKIVLGMLCYLNTSDPDERRMKNHNRPALGARPSETVIGSEITGKSWFIRSGGPVILAHERFKRDEHGGIRMIWRRGAEVNKGEKEASPREKQVNIESE